MPHPARKKSIIRFPVWNKNPVAAVLFLLPAFTVYVVFVVVPIIQTCYYSTFNWNGMSPVKTFVGFRNFQHLFANEFFGVALKNTLWFTLMNPLIQLTFAILVAWALSTYCKGYRFFKTVYFTPIILSSTAVCLMWNIILIPEHGVLSQLLTFVGLGSLNRNWLVDKGLSFNICILINSWIYVGYYIIIFFAAFVSIDKEVLESAMIDGSKGLHKLFHVTLPMIWEVLISTIVLQITGNLKAFDVIWLLTKGGPFHQNNVLTTLLYTQMQEFHFGVGSACAVVIFMISLLFTVLSIALMRRKF